MDNLLRESVADDAAGFPRLGEEPGATARVVAAVGELSVGEDAAHGREEEGKSEELHYGGCGLMEVCGLGFQFGSGFGWLVVKLVGLVWFGLGSMACRWRIVV